VNLIGEHTDYNEGFVLPLAIPQRMTVALRARDDQRVEVRSQDMSPPEAGYSLGAEARAGAWIDYVQGTTWALREAGHALRGFDAVVTSEVPVGSGLSSSAALEVALIRGLRELFGLPVDDAALVRLAHRAETAFVGVPVGVLDQMACTYAREDTALFVDTRSLQTASVPLPASVAIAVIDSGQRHEHASGGYRERRAECEEAARRLEVRALRDCGPGDLARIAALPAPLDRRARHVVTEDERVLGAVEALRAGDVGRLGALMDASHASQRDDYACSTPEIDRLVEVARDVPGVRGARLTGGGFGGAVVLLVDAEAAGQAAREAVRRAGDVAGLRPAVLVPRRCIGSSSPQ
jgi:galactokinase